MTGGNKVPMGGLARLCKLYGGMRIGGERWVWDYTADKAVKESELPFGGEQHRASERARWLGELPGTAQACAASPCPGCGICTPSSIG